MLERILKNLSADEVFEEYEIFYVIEAKDYK